MKSSGTLGLSGSAGLAAGNGPARGFLERILLHQNGTKHRCLRNVMARHFDAAALHRLRGRITKLVDDLLATASDSGSLEAVHDLTRRRSSRRAARARASHGSNARLFSSGHCVGFENSSPPVHLYVA